MNVDFALLRRQNPIPAYLKRYHIKVAYPKFCCVIPGHEDKNPSASIFDNDEKWRCHACDQGGDVVDLEMHRTGCDRPEAIARLGGESWQGPLREPPPKGSKPQLVRDYGTPPEDAPRLSPPRMTLLSKKLTPYQKNVDHLYEYRDRHGVLQAYVARVDHDEEKGGKDIFPVRWHLQHKAWMQAGYQKTEPRPLFNEHKLVERPLDEVLIVEGEKAARIAEALFPHMVVISWMGGDKNADKSDYSLLKGRSVTLWADADDVGRAAMDTVARKAQATTLLSVPISKDWGEGWDVADVAGLGPGLAEQALQARRPYRFDASPKGQAGKWQRVADGGWLPDDADLITSGVGQVKTGSAVNATLVLLHHPEFQTLSYDVMRRTILWQGEPLSEARHHLLQGRLFTATGIDIAQGFEVVLARAAMSRPVHILADRIKATPWDGDKRVERLFLYFGIKHSAWAVAGLKRWFLGHVRRVLEPGWKQDLVLILEGYQGQGKSGALRSLGQAFGYDGYARLGALGSAKMNDNDLMLIAGKTIVELSEMTAHRKSEQDHFKDVTSRDVDEYRTPYARDIIKVPRTASFAGTTNELDDYITDVTGGRRFVPMRCEHDCAVKELQADGEQLYAEAWHMLQAGEQTWFTAEEEELQVDEVEKRLKLSYVKVLLQDEIEKHGKTFMTLTDVWSILTLNEASLREREQGFEMVKRVMLALGWHWQYALVGDGEEAKRTKGFFKGGRRPGRPWAKQPLTPP